MCNDDLQQHSCARCMKRKEWRTKTSEYIEPTKLRTWKEKHTAVFGQSFVLQNHLHGFATRVGPKPVLGGPARPGPDGPHGLARAGPAQKARVRLGVFFRGALTCGFFPFMQKRESKILKQR